MHKNLNTHSSRIRLNILYTHGNMCCCETYSFITHENWLHLFYDISDSRVAPEVRS